MLIIITYYQLLSIENSFIHKVFQRNFSRLKTFNTSKTFKTIGQHQHFLFLTGPVSAMIYINKCRPVVPVVVRSHHGLVSQ